VPISRKLLNSDEHVVVSTRTHAKALLLPAFVLVAVAGLAGYLSTLPSGSMRGPLLIAIAAVAVLVVCWWVVRPFLVWMTATYTITNRRLITRSGILTRRGHDIPLPRISDVAYEHDLVDRIFGCGTLIISDASEHGQIRLHDIPRVEETQRKVNAMLQSLNHPSAGHDGT
jgi:uncharacterized membrane protein YdbT with pleckstrin-like domain